MHSAKGRPRRLAIHSRDQVVHHSRCESTSILRGGQCTDRFLRLDYTHPCTMADESTIKQEDQDWCHIRDWSVVSLS